MPTPAIEDTLLDDSRRVAPGDRAGASSFAPARVSRQSFWAEELGMADVSGDVLPLASVAEQMRDVQAMLARAQCGAATQHAQRQILDSLDRLVQQVQQCRGGAAAGTCAEPGESQTTGSAAASNTPGTKQGATPSTGKPSGGGAQPAGGPRRADAGQIRAVMKQLWGELPPRQRQQMLQLPPEEFLPRYEIMIEDYFRTLSEQKRKQTPTR